MLTSVRRENSHGARLGYEEEGRVMARHLRPVEQGIDIELVRAPKRELLGEADARDVHKRIAAELRELTDEALMRRAREVAEDFKAPARHKGLTHAEWCCLMVRMVGDVADQVFGTTVVSGPRPARQARSAIERAIGLLLVLDDGLAAFQDDEADNTPPGA